MKDSEQKEDRPKINYVISEKFRAENFKNFSYILGTPFCLDFAKLLSLDLTINPIGFFAKTILLLCGILLFSKVTL